MRFPVLKLDAEAPPDNYAAALLLLAVALIWPYSLVGPFQFDDWNVIVESPAVHSLTAWWQSMPGIRPLLKFRYALKWQGVERAAGFHLVNVLIHAANVILVWRLLQRWPGLRHSIAWWVALIFAFHPVQTEAVTYISGRSMALMAFFWLAAALLWLYHYRRLALVFFVAALATRETAWSLPFVLLVWQRAQGMPWAKSARSLWPLWLGLLGATLLILALPGYQRMLASALAARDPWSNLALQVHTLAYLLLDPVLLLRNNIDPDLPVLARFDRSWWLGFLTIVGCLVLGGRWLAGRPAVGLALLWPFLLLVPTNGLIARFDPASERHLYLALLGPAVLLCLGLTTICQGRLRVWGLSVVLSFLVVGTLMRIHDYRSESALWEATSRRSPNKARVWNNLGYALLVEGEAARAKLALSRALVLDPGFMRAQLNLERAEQVLARSGNTAVTSPLKDQ